jgi:hypothetical protein
MRSYAATKAQPTTFRRAAENVGTRQGSPLTTVIPKSTFTMSAAASRHKQSPSSPATNTMQAQLQGPGADPPHCWTLLSHKMYSRNFFLFMLQLTANRNVNSNEKRPLCLDNTTYSHVTTGYASPVNVDIHNAKTSLSTMSSE